MRRFLFCFFLFAQISVAQDFTNSWEGHFSYYNIQDLSFSGETVFAAAENSVFSYNINSDSYETFSSVNGLSGEEISAIYYSENAEILLIGYENGLIDIKKDQIEDIISVIDIAEQAVIAPDDKNINHFLEVGNKLFISTGYGISEYSLEHLEFGETFYIGENATHLEVVQTTVHNNTIYAATLGGGIKYASLENENLVDFQEWDIISPNTSWKGIAQVGNQVYAVSQENNLYRISENSLELIASLNAEVTDVSTNNSYLVITAPEKVLVYDAQGNLVNSLTNLNEAELSLNTAIYNGSNFYLGHSELGLLKTNSSGNFQMLSPEGPESNHIFDLEAVENELWVVFGEYNIDYNPYPIHRRGVSHKVGSNWYNLLAEDVFNAAELSSITVNPDEPNEVFISSFFSGLIKLEDGEAVNLYNETNGLDDLEDPTNPSYTGDVRIGGTAFDSQGNLWITNSKVEDGLKVLTPEGEIESVDITSEVTNPYADQAFSDIVIDSRDNVYFATQKNGVVAYETSTGELESISGAAGGDNLPSNDIRALAIDNDGTLWIGTNSGLRVLYNPASVFNQNVSASAIIIEEGDVAQELLFEQFITDIAVDGANNKWISTATSGVFYISENGQELLAHYTQNNSPLPSNDVSSLSIDHASGSVYIGTINGLVSFKGSATKARNNLDEVYAYPNPVRPGFQGEVVIDGLMANANVKITDIAGNLVYEEVSQGGSILWDTTAFGKYEVASGVYLVIITSEDQIETKVTKIMVIR